MDEQIRQEINVILNEMHAERRMLCEQTGEIQNELNEARRSAYQTTMMQFLCVLALAITLIISILLIRQ